VFVKNTVMGDVFFFWKYISKFWIIGLRFA